MRRFEIALPASVADCLRAMGERGPETKLLAGGTDLVPQLMNGVLKPARVVDLSGVARLRTLRAETGPGLRIGATVTARTGVASAVRRCYEERGSRESGGTGRRTRLRI